MMKFRLRLPGAAHMSRQALALAALATCACHDPLPPRRGSWAVMVYGTITTDGVPRQGIHVEYELHQDSCANGRLLSGNGSIAAASDNRGDFRFQAYSYHEIVPQCLRLFVRHSDGTRGTSADAPDIPLKPVSLNSIPYDSVRMDLSLPPDDS